ncbi:MAG: DUF4873 domain-containing protein [Streptosporangiales bacterium]|nr:DUF4873 domain-containing protein [Streptosporangiales bacterium]
MDADHPDEGYRGDAWVVADGRPIPVRINLSGHFEPIDGSYRWAGRILPHDEVTALFTGNQRDVTVRTPDGHEAAGTLVEQDPWGGCRVAGTGRPPFPLP